MSGSQGWLQGFGVGCTGKDQLREGCRFDTEPKAPRREPYPEFIKGWRIAPGVTWGVDGAGLKTVVVRGKLSMPIPWGGDGYG